MKVGCIIYDNDGICTTEKRGVSFFDVIDMAYYDQILNIKSYSGKYIEWKNGNKILEGEYLFGMKCGEWIERYEVSGRLKSKGFYFNNNRNGFWQEWYDNDYTNNKKLEETYSRCKLHGVMKCWHPNGYQSDEINYYNGIKHGASIKWNNTGRLISDHYYNNGKIDDVLQRDNTKNRYIKKGNFKLTDLPEFFSYKHVYESYDWLVEYINDPDYFFKSCSGSTIVVLKRFHDTIINSNRPGIINWKYAKLRGSRFKVVRIFHKLNPSYEYSCAASIHGPQTRTLIVIYRVGKTVHSDTFDNDLSNTCSHGIHCFATIVPAFYYNNVCDQYSGEYYSWGDNGNLCRTGKIINGIFHKVPDTQMIPY
jgi:hypothetical protein